MTDDNSNKSLVDMDDDLEAFEAKFFGNEEAEVEKEPQEDESTENEEDSLATDDEDEEASEDAPEEEEEVEEEEPEEEPKPKPKSKAQQRIEQLLERERLANERANELERRLAALEASKEVKQEETPKSLREQLPADAPNPDAKDENGEPIYELGEFDPQYIRDLTRHTIETERKRMDEEARLEQEKREFAEAQQKLSDQWMERVEEVEEDLPDLREKIGTLTQAFQSLEPAYGEYLAMTIMESDLGPQIMYYLAQNIGEAQKIVASGPAAATRAIGRLEARLSTPAPEKKSNVKKVSQAPEPPEQRTRGQGGKFSVSPDTDDLDAFEREFFKR